jgi:Tol biopolymer transport system component/Zn-dependent M28 family amino/carboxypeptidase
VIPRPSAQEEASDIAPEQKAAEPPPTPPAQEEAAPAPARQLPPDHPPVAQNRPGSTQKETNASAEESKLLSNIRQVTFVGQRAGEGYFSQDGSLLVFQSEREPGNPFYQIYLLDLQSGNLRRVSPGVGKTTCPWVHPTKRKILFASTHLDPRAAEKQKAELAQRASGQERRYSWDFDEQYDLFEADLATGKMANLSKTRGYDAEASWSPDGTLVVFASNRHAYTTPLSVEDQELFSRDPSSQLDIYLMKADGTQVRRLTASPGYDGGPFFSADGRKICWRRFSLDGASAEIFTMNVDGSEQMQITQLGAMSWGPYFHPSGDYLIFAANREGMRSFELYAVDAAGSSQPVRVTFTDGFDGLPAFSPDGKRLTWSSGRGPQKRPQIFFAEWNDTEVRRQLGLVEVAPVVATEEEAPSPTPELGNAFPPINTRGLRIHLDTLASERMEGRLTGTDGERRATEYVASIFQWLGLTPAGDNGTYFQNFQFTGGVSLGPDNQLTMRYEGGEHSWVVNSDWRPLSSSKVGTVEPAEVVFAGYGIVAPTTDGNGAYDSYAHLDVKDKWVLVFRYVPEGVSPQTRQHLNRHASLRYKTMVARDKGARGIIFVSGPHSQVKEQLAPLSFDASMSTSSIATLSVSDAVVERLLQRSGKSLADLQASLDPGTLVSGFLIDGVRLEASIDVVQEKRNGRNVLARLNAGQSPGKAAVVVGAHVDHLGRGEGTSSLAREEEKGQIHYGADDNASGVAGLLEIAQALTEAKGKGELRLQRDVIFAAWSGEELGLLGSNHFVRTVNGVGPEPSVLTPGISAYLNMDMIGRMKNAVVFQGVGSSSFWLREVERLAAPLDLAVTLQQDSYLPTDATAFYLKGVPILSAFTGAHAEYHTPRDTVEKINSEGTAKIARFMAALTQSLATRGEPPDYVAATKPPTSVGRVAVRAYLGTIPDYTPGDTVGVKIAGVVKGGPADQAGIVGGDTIIEIAGRKIENIYDYTYALDGLKIGVPVETRIIRQGQPMILKLVPASRE